MIILIDRGMLVMFVERLSPNVLLAVTFIARNGGLVAVTYAIALSFVASQPEVVYLQLLPMCRALYENHVKRHPLLYEQLRELRRRPAEAMLHACYPTSPTHPHLTNEGSTPSSRVSS
jgi:hypothetical protein